MTAGRGYLLPVDVAPAEDRCIMVFIPDDDRYLYAFMQAYRFFGKWVAWERDGSTRGKQAADRWLQSIAETEACMSVCGDILLALQGIQTTLDASQAQQIACCTREDANDAAEQQIDPGAPTGIDPVLDPPPTGAVDWDDAYCALAHAAAEAYADRLEKIAPLVGNAWLTIAFILALMLTAVPLAGMSITLIIGVLAVEAAALWAAVFNLQDAANLNQIAADLRGSTPFRSDFVCAFLLAPNDDVPATLDAFIQSEGYPAFEAAVVANALGLAQIEAFKLGYYRDDNDNVVSVDVSAYSGSKCTDCYGAVLLTNDFTTDPYVDDPVLYTGYRTDWEDVGESPAQHYMNQNSRDIDDAWFRLDQTGWVNGGYGTGTCSNLRITFDYWKQDQVGNTGTFTLSVKDASTQQQVVVWSDDPVPLAVGDKQNAVVNVPFDVPFQITAGSTFILGWTTTTNDQRLRMGIDNIQLQGDLI